MSVQPSLSKLLKNPLYLLAFGFGSGLLKPAPGTWGTLLACLIYVPIALFITHLGAKLVFLLFTFIIGVYVCEKVSRDLGIHDFGGIVWDEFVGVWLVLLFLPPALLERSGLAMSGVMAFVTFRFFDIIKPPPIKQIDRHVSGGFGIMIDDIVAGIFALICLYLITFIFI